VLAAASIAQPWRKLASDPSINDFEAIWMINANRGFAVGRYATFVETSDGGATWSPTGVSTFYDQPFYNVQFRNASVGFATGNVTPDNRDLWRTLDGGQSWHQVTEPSTVTGGSWRTISFTGTQTVFIGANGALIRSQNNGQTWSVRSAYPSCPVIYSMAFRDDQVGVVSGNLAGTGVQGIFRTTDGGATWTQRSSAPCNDMMWLEGNSVLAISGSQILRSDNSGDTWYVHGTAPAGLYRFTRVTSSMFAATDELGGIYLSWNGAVSWTRVRAPIFDLPKTWGIHFIDSLTGWVVGERGLIYKTTDGGITWQQMSNGVNMQSLDIHAFDENVLLSIGDIGLILRSTDAGKTWKFQRQKVTGVIWNRYEDIKASDIHRPSGLVIAAGAGAVVFRSTDRGETWQSVGYPAIDEAFGFRLVDVVSQNVAYMVSGALPNTYFWKSTNGGLTWSSTHMPKIDAFDIEFVDENLGFLVVMDTNQSPARYGFYRTINGGATWTFQEVPTPHSSLHTMKMVNASVGYLMGIGYVGKTTNGGASWQQLPIGNNRYWSSMHAPNLTDVYLGESGYANFEPKLYMSKNGGSTWSTQGAGNVPFYLDAITTTPAGKLYVSGFQGDIFTTAPATETLTPSQYTIESGNYVSGSVSSLWQSDDVHLKAATPNWSSPVILRFEATAASLNPTAMTLTYEGHLTGGNAFQDVELYDFNANTWVIVSSVSSSSVDTVVTVQPTQPGRFVQAGTRKVQARVRLSSSSKTGSRSMTAGVDLVRWELGY
jgi:photosystem II stability/assembly factor-like uncharacterized protein